ncbi:MAG: hypothetical protein ACFFFB_16865 [Candidatus Heimdallarchaeota archaeon]
MLEKHNFFLESIKNEDFDSINNLLIEASRRAKREDLIYFDYLIENAKGSLLEKVKLNLIYLIGEIGENNILESKYLEYLIKSYFDSDRWIRNEIIQSLGKIVDKNEVSSEIYTILAYAVLEDYIPTKMNALKLLRRLKHVPNIIIKNIIKVIDVNNLEIVEYSIRVLKNHIKDEIALFNILNTNRNYTLLTKNSFRTLLIEYFDFITSLETFKEKILKADWIDEYQNLFVKEIESFQRILLNRK